MIAVIALPIVFIIFVLKLAAKKPSNDTVIISEIEL